MMGTDVDLLFGIDIVVNPEITLEFAEGVACAVDVLAALVIGVVAVIGGDILTEKGLATVVTPLEFPLSVLWEEPITFC